jgi:hypothetical protein
MANEFNTLITFGSKNQVDIVRLFEFIKEIWTIDVYGIEEYRNLNFSGDGYASFEIKVVGNGDTGVDTFLRIIDEGFADVSVYYTSSDFVDVFITNDKFGVYYPNKYLLEIYSDNPSVTNCARLGFADYWEIQRFLSNKYHVQLDEGVSLVENAIYGTYNVKISEYEVVC